MKITMISVGSTGDVRPYILLGKELKKRGIHHQKVVFSPEEPVPTIQLEAPPPGRRSVPASNPWVPATAGLLLGSAVVRDILTKERETTC